MTLGLGSKIIILILSINLVLFISFPNSFATGADSTLYDTKVTSNLANLGIGFGEENVTNSTYNQTITITSDDNQTSTLFGLPEEGESSIVSTIVYGVTNYVWEFINFIRFLVNFLYAPVTVFNQIGGPPQIQILFGVILTVLYAIALIQFLSGRVF